MSLKHEDILVCLVCYLTVIWCKGLGASIRIEFGELIYRLTGKRVLPVQESDNIIEILRSALMRLLNEYGPQGNRRFVASRPNDISANTRGTPNLEEELVRLFNDEARRASADAIAQRLSPLTGYPNISISVNNRELYYVDVKVTSREQTGSPRDIYVSPGPVTRFQVESVGTEQVLIFKTRRGNLHVKVKNDAHHIMILCRARRVGQQGNLGQWSLEQCRIYDISNLQMRIKIEFNASFGDLRRELWHS
jgi:hypothetical protein